MNHSSNGPLLVEPDGKPGASVAFWLETSLKRVFPASPVGTTTNLHLMAARNGQVSFQACLQNRRVDALDVDCTVLDAEDLKPQVRKVGYVLMPHFTPNTGSAELDGIGLLPGLVPDPLYPTSTARVAPWENQAFWITLKIPADAQPGRRELKIRWSFNKGASSAELPVTLEISPLIIEPRHDFPIIHWWRGEAIWDWYKTDMFDERWWQLTEAYLTNMLAHGSDVVYVPIFFNRRETFKRPCQLLVVDVPKPDEYTFDWSRVKRFVEMSKKIGFRKFEWSHLWIYWGVENPIRVYTKTGGKDDCVYEMTWPPDTQATSDTYIKFLRQFLPQFHTFLVEHEILDYSYFHLSDEPGSDKDVVNYRKAREVLWRLAPWMKVMDALSDIRYGREGLTDIPIPVVSSAQNYIDEKIPHWVYYCCAPLGPWINRFFDTPLPKIRMTGWLFYRLRAQGFLHWGFNYWHKLEREELTDPFTDATAACYPAIPSGDPFMVYPGPDGPIDSIRWEVFTESMQDYAILQSAGVKSDDPMLSPIKTYADFPKNERWIEDTVERILRAPAVK